MRLISGFHGTCQTELFPRSSGTEWWNVSGKLLRRLVITIYVVVGIFVAWEHGYLGLGWLRAVASALLAIILWFLVPLGVNLHIH
jgi:hypothetical protein